MLGVRLQIISLLLSQHEMDNKKTFIRYISHEIRSPLSTTSLGLDYLIDQIGLQKMTTFEEVLEVVKDAKVTCELATSTLNDLLMFDKIETGMLEVSTTVSDAWDFAQSCINPFRLQVCIFVCQYTPHSSNHIVQAATTNVALGCTLIPAVEVTNAEGALREFFVSGSTHPHWLCEHREISMNIDKYKMEQVVRNFMTNALKFTPAYGDIAVNVSVLDCYSPNIHASGDLAERQPLTKQSVLRLEVVDGGAGIAPVRRHC